MSYSEGQHTGAACHPTAFPLHVRAEADAIAPNRNRQSDGICGDEAHAQRVSDHNPDPRGVPHAVDLTQDPAHFDAHAYGLRLAGAFVAGHGDGRIKYLVANFGRGDVIFDPAVSLSWRPNASTGHETHLHVSFHYSPAVEQSTAPFFHTAPPVSEDEVTPADYAKIEGLFKEYADRTVAAIAADINGAVDRLDAATAKALAAIQAAK